MSKFWSELTHRLTPYVPGEQPRHPLLVKLNTNESPYDPSPGVMQAIAAVESSALRLYPDPESTELREAAARHFGLSPSEVFLGNGSDEVLAHTFQALLQHDDPLLFPDISYSFYPVWCELYSIRFRRVPLRRDFTVAPEDYDLPCGAVIIPNPNAPTGLLLSLNEVRRLLEDHPDAVVVIDEAYIDFGGDSATALIPEYDNLLVVQTLSKSRALAGLRVGLALGQTPLIEGLERVKNSFNSYPLDAVSQRAALAAFADEAYYRECCDRIIDSRERLAAGLRALGFEVLPSAANFLFARHPQRDAAQLFTQLREHGIVVRHFDKPRISQYLRISIGREAECERVLEVLAQSPGG